MAEIRHCYGRTPAPAARYDDVGNGPQNIEVDAGVAI